MTKRQRGERNWVDSVGDYIFHQPNGLCGELEQTEHMKVGHEITIRGRTYIKAADGKLEAVED